MKKIGTLSFLAAPLLATSLALANPIAPPSPSGGSSGAKADSGTDNSGDSGCSLVGSRLARRLGPWVIAGAFSVTYLFMRRRPRL